MKITPRWPGNTNRNRKKRAVPKPKIRWQQLGLRDPANRESSSSIDEIRREVMTLSTRGLAPRALAQGVRSRTGGQTPPAADTGDLRAGARKGRRGAA